MEKCRPHPLLTLAERPVHSRETKIIRNVATERTNVTGRQGKTKSGHQSKN
jgi:hypothetical protein